MQKEKIRFSRVKDLPNLELYRGRDVANFVPWHVHWVFSLSVIDEGVRIHETKQGKYSVTPGSILIVDCREAHSGSVPNDYTCSSRSIRIDPVLLNYLTMQVTGRQYNTSLLHKPVIYDPELARHIINLHSALGESLSRIEKECLLLDIFAKLYDRHSREEHKGYQPGRRIHSDISCLRILTRLLQ